MTFYNFNLNDHSFAHLLKFIFPLSHAVDRAMSTVSISKTQEISLVSKKYTLHTPIHQGEKRTKYISRVNNSISQRIESSIST